MTTLEATLPKILLQDPSWYVLTPKVGQQTGWFKVTSGCRLWPQGGAGDQ